jgi:O-succinylbenzoic acid--CoA ligase
VRGSARDVLALLRDWDATVEEPQPITIETSGSTGEPKQVVLSRSAMRASARATQDRLGGAGQWLLNLPAAYVAGTQVLFRSIVAGTEPVVQDGDFESAAAAMNGSRRYVSLVPTQLTRMLESAADLEALRGFDAVLVGGARVDPVLRGAAERAGLRIVATYGMSETCGGCVYDGVPLDGVAVALAPDGRIRLGGPVLFEEYAGAPELTAEVKQDGWFLTADIGRVDEDGRLQVLGRIDDVVISGGVNVPTPAVSARLREHEAIGAAEVVGVPDDEWGQRVVALVVLAPSAAEPSLEELRDFVAQRHPRSWAPRSVEVLEAIPLLGNGKTDRVRLMRSAEPERTRISTADKADLNGE